jgi:hypothetical protein
MKKAVIVSVLGAAAQVIFALPSVAILDFDSGSFCTEQEALVMTGLFRNEMVRSSRADVVDRKHLDAIKREIMFQRSLSADFPPKIFSPGPGRQTSCTTASSAPTPSRSPRRTVARSE